MLAVVEPEMAQIRTRNEKRSMGLPARVGNGDVPLAITVVTYARATVGMCTAG
jgi:hypothetical protein